MILTQLILLSFPSWKSLAPVSIARVFCNLFGLFERILWRSAIMSDHHDAKIKGRCAKVWEKDYPLSIEGELLFLHLNLQLSGNVQEIKIDS